MHHILAFGVILVALVFWIISVQRSLVGMVANIDNAMSQIGVQLSSQWEILTSLLDLTERYTNHECVTLAETMKERHSITKDSLPDDVREQEHIIAEAVSKIAEVAEKYHDLKGDCSYIKTKDAVHQYENMVQTSMLIYNDSAGKLNHAIRKFPASMVAGILGFSNRAYFEKKNGNSC